MDALGVAKAAWKLGAGRSKAGDPIDSRVGIRLLHIQGEKVEKGEELMEIHHSSPTLKVNIRQQLEEAIFISEGSNETVNSLIVGIM